MKVVAPVLAVFVLVFAISFVVAFESRNTLPVVVNTSPESQPAGVAQSQTPSTSTATVTESIATSSLIVKTQKNAANKAKNALPKPDEPTLVERVEAPYSTQPEKFETIEPATRSALVNILCMPRGGTLRPISGSGVIIDPRGVILTNAHVAQYVMLSQSPLINLSCTIRGGSPASNHWKAQILYIPPIWVEDHFSNINADHVAGTGEHDYALLLIVSDTQGNAINSPLPYLPIETRENVAFKDDTILIAGYPAEFVGGIATQQGLYAATSLSTIKQLLTFQTTSVDVFSLGGVIAAQGGSSGGPVVNAWRRVVGLIVTTSEGATTDARDLHAMSLNYIDRDLSATAGQTLESMLDKNVSRESSEFTDKIAPELVQKYIDYLKR